MTNSDHTYSDQFYNHIESGSLLSAEKIISHLLSKLPVKSVLDVGCGRGAWLSVWEKHNIKNIQGVDGDYVDMEKLHIAKKSFKQHNLEQPLKLNKKFDLVQSLEVAEHLKKDAAEQFVDSLISHGDAVLFSAAVPGQGGVQHINEQPYEYWRKKFADRGYDVFDFIRPAIIRHKDIEPWYRYNTLLYIKKDTKLHKELRDSLVPPQQKIKNVSSFPWKLRLGLLRFLPRFVVNRLASIVYRTKS